MAEDDSERTEDPTQKRLDDALERGDVVKSQMTITDNALNDGNTVCGVTNFYHMLYPYWTFLVEKSTPEWSSGTTRTRCPSATRTGDRWPSIA